MFEKCHNVNQKQVMNVAQDSHTYTIMNREKTSKLTNISCGPNVILFSKVCRIMDIRISLSRSAKCLATL